MSKHETWRTELAAQMLAGDTRELHLEYLVTKGSSSQSRRLADALLVLPDGQRILIETKPNRIGYSVVGQVLGKAWQLQQGGEPVDRLVVVCGKGDDAVEAYCASQQVEVIIVHDQIRPSC